MRFHSDGPSIPDVLLQRCDEGRVVFLCGAGVSLPSGMPNFVDLTKHVIEFFDPPADSDIMSAFRPWMVDEESATNVPLDQIFNLLHLEYGKNEVNALVTARLNTPLESKRLGREHNLIRRISSSQGGIPQIVTTNFDRLFEMGWAGKDLPKHQPPAFPDLNYGSTIEGVTYLHGRLVDATSESHPYVLSSADFGRAYLSEGWATNFIRHLLERYTVVLVGYKAEDPPVKYLLQGLNHDGQYDRSRLYAFDRGLPEEIEAKWRDRGVTAIGYADHPCFWRSMEAWANRADDPRKWRASVVTKSQQDPKDLAPFERGQIAHILRTAQGAKLFSEAHPTPHPEWVCVMDANVRSGEPSRGFGNDAESFDPRTAYGLDDDLRDITADERKQGVRNDNLIAWLDGDDSPHELHRLGGRQPNGFQATPKRLEHLIAWASKATNSPVLAWWAIRQNGLHPRLLHRLQWHVRNSNNLHSRARHIWNMIFEHHQDPRNREWDGLWFGIRRRINSEGWTNSVLRELQRAAVPRLKFEPPLGLGKSKPPQSVWDDTHLGDIGRCEVVFLERHRELLDIPDDRLPEVFRLLEDQLLSASGLLKDIEPVYFRTPTCYPNRDVDGEQYGTKAKDAVAWFIQIFDQTAVKWPKLANAHAMTWPMTDPFFFRKLKLYAFNSGGVFDAESVVQEVLSLDQKSFWDVAVVRELLFLLTDRWDEFSQERQCQLIDRILTGPDVASNGPEENVQARRNRFAAGYARYLQLRGCTLQQDRGERLAEMISNIPNWNDAFAASMVIQRGSHSGWVATDENADSILDVPVAEVVPRAIEDMERDASRFTERRPFTGLVKANPRKALSALTIAGRANDYPTELWSSLINDISNDIKPRLKRAFLNRVAGLPCSVIAELRHTLGRWLEQKFATILGFDERLGWAVYDHVVRGILSGGEAATASGLGEVYLGGKIVERSRRTYENAFNSPVGMCADALFDAVPNEKQEANSHIPIHIKRRIELLFSAPGEGSDHAISIAAERLDWLMFVDPDWTKDRLLPMLAFGHPASEPAWNGFLHRGQMPQPTLVEIIKPLLLDLFPRIEEFSWEHNLAEIAASWLGNMRVFHPDEAWGLSRGEMRAALRAMSGHTRNQFIFWLGQVGQVNEGGWAKHVIPLIDEDWPRERRYKTASSMRAWIGLLDDTGNSFPAVYDAVKKFLVPIETNESPFYRFTREINDEIPITIQFPETTLDLMNRATPEVLTRPPDELPKVLALIAEAQPNLASDPRYLRLIDLVERN